MGAYKAGSFKRMSESLLRSVLLRKIVGSYPVYCGRIFANQTWTHQVNNQRSQKTAHTDQNQNQNLRLVDQWNRREAAVQLDVVVYPVGILVDRRVLGHRTGGTGQIRIRQQTGYVELAIECMQQSAALVQVADRSAF